MVVMAPAPRCCRKWNGHLLRGPAPNGRGREPGPEAPLDMPASLRPDLAARQLSSGVLSERQALDAGGS